MAIGRRIWPVQGDPLRRNPSRAATPRPAEPGFERWMWYFTRISGLLLVVLAMGHMLIMHVLVQLTGQEINFAFVLERWGNPFWRGYDLYDQKNVGFVSTGAEAERIGTKFDTSALANGNGGHVFGTTLPAVEKDSLLEYLKTL